MHVADLDVFRYHDGPFEPQNWAVPLRAVGWLEHPEPFTTGKLTSVVTSKLKAMPFPFLGVWCSISRVISMARLAKAAHMAGEPCTN